MKKDWINTLTFTLEFVIGDNSNMTRTMIEHKMFPGNRCKSTLVLRPLNPRTNYRRGIALTVHTKVTDCKTGMVIDEFDMSQGTFTRFISNVCSPQLSTLLN